MPSDQAMEKSDILLKLGAVVERVKPAPIIDPEHYVNRARRLAREHTSNTQRTGRGYFADQFENPANLQAHFGGTGPEIWRQCEGHLDAFVTGAGTGGTISGVSKYLKPKLRDLRVVLADPQGSGLYNRVKHGVLFNQAEREGTRRRSQVDSVVEGIGLNRLTANFKAGKDLIDDAIKVGDKQAVSMARWLVENDGIFVGSSSAVNCKTSYKSSPVSLLILAGVAAAKTAQSIGPGHRIVTILCDSGSRHLSKFWNQVGDIGGASEMVLEKILNPPS